jgi:hypothetical protein
MTHGAGSSRARLTAIMAEDHRHSPLKLHDSLKRGVVRAVWRRVGIGIALTVSGRRLLIARQSVSASCGCPASTESRRHVQSMHDGSPHTDLPLRTGCSRRGWPSSPRQQLRDFFIAQREDEKSIFRPGVLFGEIHIAPSVRRTLPKRRTPIESSLCQGLRRRGREERSDEEFGGWLAWALGLALAREWLLRRAGGSGCEPVTLDAESFPVCPPGSLAVSFGSGRLASLIMRL